MPSHTAPTANSADRIRKTLAGIVKANVAVQRYAVRVVVLGSRADAETAIRELSQIGFVAAGGSALCGHSISSNGAGDRHQIFAYQIA